jgi:hypothetical protein
LERNVTWKKEASQRTLESWRGLENDDRQCNRSHSHCDTGAIRTRWVKYFETKKGHRVKRCPITYQQLDFAPYALAMNAGGPVPLLVLVDRAKFLALGDRANGSGGSGSRNRGSGPIALEQNRNHRAFRFLHERQLAFAEHVDADEVS